MSKRIALQLRLIKRNSPFGNVHHQIVKLFILIAKANDIFEKVTRLRTILN